MSERAKIRAAARDGERREAAARGGEGDPGRTRDGAAAVLGAPGDPPQQGQAAIATATTGRCASTPTARATEGSAPQLDGAEAELAKPQQPTSMPVSVRWTPRSRCPTRLRARRPQATASTRPMRPKTSKRWRREGRSARRRREPRSQGRPRRRRRRLRAQLPRAPRPRHEGDQGCRRAGRGDAPQPHRARRARARGRRGDRGPARGPSDRGDGPCR